MKLSLPTSLRPLRRAYPLGVGLALFSVGCAGHSAKTLEARHALDAGQPNQALALYNESMSVKSGAELPDDVGGDNALLILDRSMILQSVSDYEHSSRDLEIADKQVELLDFSHSTVDDIGKYVFSDDSGPYRAPPYEKLLVNTMNMVNYLARHDLNGAKIEARRLAIVQKHLRETKSPAVSMMAPGSYLAGFAFEKSGRADEALRYYEEAIEFGDFASLREPVRRLENLTAYRSAKLDAFLARDPNAAPAPEAAATDATPPPAENPAVAPKAAAPEPGELLVIVQYGRVPAKEAKRIPIGLALTYGALYLSPAMTSQANYLAAQGLVTWINYPELEEKSPPLGRPSAKVNGKYVQLEGALAVDVETKKAYERDRGAIIASAVTRMIARAAIGTAAGAAGQSASGDSLVGALISIGTQAALVAADTPDTRSWATLPARIAISRIALPPGRHEIILNAQGTTKTLTVNMTANGWAAVVLTALR